MKKEIIQHDSSVVRFRFEPKYDNEEWIIDAEDYSTLCSRNWYAGVNNKYKYLRYKCELFHRVILGVKDRHVAVDHINHDTRDNRKINLRICSIRQNVLNAKKCSDGWLSSKGVTLDKSRSGKQYKARITVNYQEIQLGYYSTEYEAALAYNRAARKHFGEFAYQNDLRLATHRHFVMADLYDVKTKDGEL